MEFREIHRTGVGRDSPRSGFTSIARSTGFDEDQVRAIWPLVGTRAELILTDRSSGDHSNLPETPLPLAFVDWSIEHEWVATLDDLVERRLMLAWSPCLSSTLLRTLAERLSHAGKLDPSNIDSTIASTFTRLAKHYGARVP